MLTDYDGPTIRIGREPPYNPHFYDVVLKWIHDEHPACVPMFELCGLPFEPTDWAGCRLFVAWIQDPSELEAPEIHRNLVAIGEACDRRGIRIVNRAECQSHLTKLEAARRLRAAGIRTPNVVPVRNREELIENFCGLNPPIVVTSNVGHARPCLLVENREDAQKVQITNFRQPVATEFVDVRNPKDGRVRKYRCTVIGDRVVTSHMQTSENWVTRGASRVKDVQTREEEIAYLITPDRFEAKMLAARRALEVDFIGIDYGIDASGEPVIWEANQYPEMDLARNEVSYQNFATQRAIAALLLTYLEWAQIEPSAKLIRQASYED